MKKTTANAVTGLVVSQQPTGIITQQKSEALLASVPPWLAKVENKEDAGNAMLVAGQEFLVAVDDILLRKFEFDDTKLKQFHRELKDMMEAVNALEKEGLNISTPHSMDAVGEKLVADGIVEFLGEIAETKFRKEKFNRVGMEVPLLEGAAPFIKKLQEKNNKV